MEQPKKKAEGKAHLSAFQVDKAVSGSYLENYKEYVNNVLKYSKLLNNAAAIHHLGL